jgi:hypothetical protein
MAEDGGDAAVCADGLGAITLKSVTSEGGNGVALGYPCHQTAEQGGAGITGNAGHDYTLEGASVTGAEVAATAGHDITMEGVTVDAHRPANDSLLIVYGWPVAALLTASFIGWAVRKTLRQMNR